MRLSARVDYAVRACVVLATQQGDGAGEPSGGWTKADDIAAAQAIPAQFLDTILRDLRRGGLLDSRRGQDGGHRLARPAAQITVAEVIRAIDGPLALVRGLRPENLAYPDSGAAVQQLWLRLRAAEREVLDGTTIADLAP
ncbi:RrF2 family transcriptional regulator [Angustibacter luteus]|uniref:RrF2 family transcriptional regulator n=1 Tax=Angustibacter luteus TaxID=658456 RepID=A0ABW1JB43_9ACTN